jgi:ribosomal protein S27AE
MNDLGEYCPKCGFDHTISGAVDVLWGHWSKTCYGTYNLTYFDAAPEALRCKCGNCGYEWLRDTEDKCLPI